MKDKAECFLIVKSLWGVGWKCQFRPVNNLSIILPTKHNFEHNTLVSRVMPKRILIFYFLSINKKTLPMARVPTAEKFEIAKIIRQSLWNLCWTRPNHTVIVMSSSSKCFLSHLDAKSTFSNIITD